MEHTETRDLTNAPAIGDDAEIEIGISLKNDLTLGQKRPRSPRMPSPTLSRKDRERKVREGLISDHARRLLLSQGYQGFSLDDLAKAIK